MLFFVKNHKLFCTLLNTLMWGFIGEIMSPIQSLFPHLLKPMCYAHHLYNSSLWDLENGKIKVLEGQ